MKQEDLEGLGAAADLRDAGRYAAALAAFRALEGTGDSTAEEALVLQNEFNCQCWLGRTDEAKKLLARVTALVPELIYFRIWAEVAEATLETMEDKECAALARLDRILREWAPLLTDPELRHMYEEVQLRRGSLLTRKGEYEKALPLLEQGQGYARAKGPEFYHDLGVCYFAGGNYARARESLERSLAMGPDALWALSAHGNLGKVFLSLGAYARALKELEEADQLAAELNAPREPIYKLLAITFEKLKMADQAARYRQMLDEAKS